ncbi:transporter substrate-binding domain-containing protein [Pseudoduganella sp. LjRoot289]|uniref:substrate-binding periplasmic protein n=1 Tax=Pseudoduganella sp. LjRoot289 TaxID=3342314 RepID=UPI003ECFE916
MPNTSKRAFLLSCALLASQAMRLPAAHSAPQTVTLLLGDTLDAKGKQKPLPPWRRKLFDYLEQELNIRFEIKIYPWPRAERNALNGTGLIFGLPKTADRLRELHYSDAASSNTLWLVTRSDATFPFQGIQDLRGKTLGAVRGYSYGDEFERERNKLFRVDDEIASRATRLQRLLLKRVDAVLLYQPSGESQPEIEAQLQTFIQPYLKDLSVPPGVTLSVRPKPLHADTGQFFAVARAHDDGLIERINGALARQRKVAQR